MIRPGFFADGVAEAMAAVLQHSRSVENAFDPELSAKAFCVLALWSKSAAAGAAMPKGTRIIARAERLLIERLGQPINIRTLAEELGVAYSVFRRAFKERTGLAPWEYVIRQRLRRSRRILAATDATLTEIADQLGFSSSFHFSRTFHQAYGLSPSHWRRQLAASRRPMQANADKLIHLDLEEGAPIDPSADASTCRPMPA